MKKNRMMRLASVLLVLVLLTTSVISGTFAKYITSDEQYDTARVAKFGVVASLSGDLFGATYVGATDNSITTYGVNDGTVSSSVNGEDFVVAPGTENIKGLVLSITGTPEVATKVIFDAAEDDAGVDYADSDIYLKAGTYGIMVPVADTAEITNENIVDYYVKTGDLYTKAQAGQSVTTLYELHNEITVNEDYHPLKWFIDGDTTKEYTLAAVKTEVENKFKDNGNDLTFEPNKANDTSINIGWKWNYGTAWTADNENIVDEDKMDTILGDMMAKQKDTAKEIKYDVVLEKNSGYVAITYDTANAAADSANKIIVAKVQNDVVACLTVAFNARLTVEQVD